MKGVGKGGANRISDARRAKIRAARATMTQAEVAKRFKIHLSTVSRIASEARGKAGDPNAARKRSKVYKRPDTVEDYIRLLCREEIETYFRDLLAGRRLGGSK